MKYGFIGTGNMSSAIIKGIISKNKANPEDIFIYDLNIGKQNELVNSFCVNGRLSANEIAKECDFVFLAVKPNVMKSVIKEISGTVKDREPVIISIAAGKSIEFVEGVFGFRPSIIRVMPNVNALVGESMSALCKNKTATAESFEKAIEIFSSIGKAIALDESYFSNFIGLSGSAPAYVYLFIDSIARAGVKAGLDKKTSLEIAAQAVLGSAKMVLEAGKHPWELIDMVCSPGGTTIEGVSSLLDDGFEGIIMRAVEKVIEKDKRL